MVLVTFRRSMLATSLALLAGLTPAAPSAAASCTFILGFADLAHAISQVVGDCADNQASALNGDAIQHTTQGMLVWRKFDNWTAFTNGYETWIAGPQGLQKRLNRERFPWETSPPLSTQCPIVGPDELTAYRQAIAVEDTQQLAVCAGSPLQAVREGVARNAQTDSETLRLLAQDRQPFVRGEVGANPHTPPGVLAALAADSFPVAGQVASNPFVPTDVLARLVGRVPPEAWGCGNCDGLQLLLGLALNQRADPGLLRRLASHVNGDIRNHVAQNPSVPGDLLTVLAADSSPYVASQAANTIQKRIANPPLLPAPIVSPDVALDAAWQMVAKYSPRLMEIAGLLAIRPVIGPLAPSVYGSYMWGRHDLRINSSLAGAPPDEVAAVLVHEMTHAYQDAKGDFRVGTACFQLEKEAFDAQKDFWLYLYGSTGKPGASTEIAREMNSLAAMGLHDDVSFLRQLITAYLDQCAG